MDSILLLNYFFGYLLSIWLIFPYITRNISFVLVIPCIIVWIISAIVINNKIPYKKSIIFTIIWFSFGILYRITSLSSVLQLHLTFWFPFFLFLFYKKNGIPKLNIYFFKLLLLTIMVSFALNCYNLFLYPNASELINFPEGKHFLSMNIGQTPYSFFAILLFFIVIPKFNYKINNSNIILYFFAIVLSLILILQMKRAISLLVFFIGIGLLIFHKYTYKQSIKKKIIFVTSCFFIIFMFFSTLSTIFINFIIDFSKSIKLDNRLISRFYELRRIIVENNIDYKTTSSGVRLLFYFESLSTWISSPKNFFIGMGNHQYDESHNSGIGGHSEFFDNLAKYGLLGSFLFFLSLFYMFKDIYNVIEKEYKYIFFIIIIMTMIYLVLNGISGNPAIGIALFLIMPLNLSNNYNKGV